MRVRKFWYFHLANPVVAKGELGSFKYVFRRFWVEVSTDSGNFKSRWTAGEYPYGYLLASINQGNIETVQGFFERMYMWSMLILTDQGLVDDMDKAVSKFEKRMAKKENTDDEGLALQEMKEVQKYVDATKKERKKMDKEVDRKFKKALKKAEKEYPENGSTDDE